MKGEEKSRRKRKGKRRKFTVEKCKKRKNEEKLKTKKEGKKS